MRLFRSGSTVASLLVVLIAVPALAQDRDAGGEQAMLDAINARRAAQGLAPLSRDARLDAAAVRHSAEMAERNVLEHVSEGSGTPADRVHAAGLAIDEIAENVAMHNDTASAQQALEQSEPHLANMLNPRFTHVGVASVRDERGLYVTQVYGRVESAPEAPTPAPEPPQIIAPESAPPPAPAPAPAGVQVLVPPASRATVGYWVCSENRWWYYPMPAGAQAGQQLHADTSVTGGPPGYDPSRCVAGQMVQPTEPPPRVFQAAPPPRAYYPPVYQPPPPAVYYPPPPPPRVYYPPPRRGSRYIVVQPPPGRMIVPYAPHYRGGVQVEVGPRPRVRVWRR